MKQPTSPWFGIAALVVVLTASNAGAVQHKDAQALSALYKRSLDLTQGLTDATSRGVSQLNATGDAQALDCLETLREASNQVTDQLMDVADVASVAASLRHPADRRTASAAAAKAATRALGILPIEARQINRTAGLCLRQPGVQDRARDQLALINDATAALTRLRVRRR